MHIIFSLVKTQIYLVVSINKAIIYFFFNLRNLHNSIVLSAVELAIDYNNNTPDIIYPFYVCIYLYSIIKILKSFKENLYLFVCISCSRFLEAEYIFLRLE